MGNNELSGPVVTTFLVKWLMSIKNRRFTYRIIYIPETIGSIVYLSKHIDHLKKKLIEKICKLNQNNIHPWMLTFTTLIIG